MKTSNLASSYYIDRTDSENNFPLRFMKINASSKITACIHIPMHRKQASSQKAASPIKTI
jgi:hypothetical protein